MVHGSNIAQPPRIARGPVGCSARAAGGRRGFTIIELIVSILIIGLLISIAIVGLRAATKSGRQAALRQNAISIRVGVDAFKQDLGFLPPLVKDGLVSGAPTPPGNKPIQNKAIATFSRSVPADKQYLQDFGGSTSDPDGRYSVYSLAYYLAGALPEDLDGFDGPGMSRPKRDGQFDLAAGKRVEPFIDVAKPGIQLRVVNVDEGRYEIVDQNGVAYRYYRWLPDDSVTKLAERNVPNILGTPEGPIDPDYSPATDDTKLRDAEYAIVGAGANGVFGEELTESVSAMQTATGTSLTGAALERRAREDNVVEVGR
ncbi:MAG: prepilin-type N-terminal cleavage/methylation domain-containing protein [Phycisphaerales bacterium]|jgi:prepilin-type N-terminal cleavage/methylation domain-containing protein|nr:prepilin-type N-terminal cleavage/methylation domain-containing protein [Phycisphaerales bacterium]